MDVKAVVSVLILALVALGVTAWLGGYAVSQTDQQDSDENVYSSYDDDRDAPPLDEDDQRPKAVAEETLFEFGVMELGEKADHTFTIKNEGEDTLVIAKGASTCKCTVSELPNNEIAPGESAEVRLEWEPKSVSDMFAQSAKIWTNDPDNRDIDFRVEGKVTNKFDLIPGTNLNAGFVHEESGAKTRLIVSSLLTEQMSEPEIDYAGDWLNFETEKLTGEDLLQPGAKTGFRINVHVLPSIPVGEHREIFEVKFKADGKENQFEITVQCHRRGPVTIIAGPGTVYVDRLQLVNFQRFAAAEGKKQTVSVLIDDPPDGEEIEISLGKVTNPNLKVHIERNTQLAIVNRQAFNLTFEIPPGAPPLDYPSTRPLKVPFRTTHPVVTEFTLNLALDSF